MAKTKRITFLLIMVITIGIPVAVLTAETENPVNHDATLIRVGWFNHPGSQEMKNGQPYGYNYDFLMELAQYNNWAYEFVEIEFSDALSMLQTGELDLVGSLFQNENRTRLYDFAQMEVGHTYITLFTSQDSHIQTHNFEDFDGLSVATICGSAHDAFLRTYAQANGFTYRIVPCISSAAVMEAVTNGTADAGILSTYIATGKTRVLAEFSPLPYYFATTKGNNRVLSELNSALTQLKIEKPYLEIELYQKYFAGTEISHITKEEQEIINASKTSPVTIGILANCAPIGFWDKEKNAFSGISIEILDYISLKTGLHFAYTTANPSRSAYVKNFTVESPKLVAGAVRCAHLPDSQNLFLTDDLITDAFMVVGLQGTNLAEKKTNKTIAVISSFEMSKKYATQYLPDFTIVEYSTLEECLDAVVEKKVDAAVYLRLCINYFLQKPYYEKLTILPTYPEPAHIVIAGLSNEVKPLLRIINKGLRMITEEESRSIGINCTIMNQYQFTINDVLYKYWIPILIIVFLVIVVASSLILISITQYKSKQAIRKSLILVEQASAAKGHFTSRMSHEIRTPLNAIIGYNTIARSELSEAKGDTGRRQAEMKVMNCLTKSDIASRHLLTIVNDVLDMAAIESGKINVVKERFDFKGVINSLSAVFYSQAKTKGVEFDVQFVNHMEEWIVGDQMRVSQILTNLLSNAVKFTPDGGRVTLFVYPETYDDHIQVLFKVRDTGIGMSSEYLERIWNPFEQADDSISRRFGGTGLGLSITKTLVDLMGGTISVESTQGEGTLFTVGLSFQRTEQPKENDSYDFSGINILIVDDDASTCDYIRLLLSRSGVRNAAVTSGAEAINAVKASIENNDLYTVCLIDWRMPQMDGVETIKKIREIVGDNLPVIVISAYDLSEISDEAADLGINRFISKPLFQSSLFNLLADISGIPRRKEIKKAASYNFSGYRVLLAEDNAMNMEIARRILESVGLSVDCAWNGKEAVDIFTKTPSGTYAAILMDIQMPTMDGYTATRLIRLSAHSQAETIPIIAMTADAFSENIAESLVAGMNDHISKPIDLPTLFEVLAKYIQ